MRAILSGSGRRRGLGPGAAGLGRHGLRVDGPRQPPQLRRPGAPAQTPEQVRAATRTALAMFEALNAIDRRYQSYLGFPAADRAASPDAAAATAAYKVLVHHYPAQKAAIEDSYTLAMAGIRDEPAREAGKAMGEKAAAAAIAAGGIDPAIAQEPYRPAHHARRMDRRLAALARAALGRLPPLGDAERRGASAAAAAWR